MTLLIISAILCYLLGSVPTALIAGRLISGIDIRQHGSGNAGATNIYRVFGMRPYITVLSIDILKGYLAVALIAPIGYGLITDQRTALLCGVTAILGHVYTLFAGFKGGKGVATACGVFLGLAPLTAIIAVVVYLLVTITTKYVALGSITAAVSAPITLAIEMLLLGHDIPVELLALATALALFMIYTHRANISRLLKGEERKTDFLEKLRKKNE